MNNFVVAIDGPAAAGKGTIARALAAEFGFHHLDTGLLDRAVGARVLAGDDAEHAAQNLSDHDILEQDLRTPEIAKAASVVAVQASVRDALVQYQRDFAKRGPGVVLDGRDIGTVICPEANVKLFVTASAEMRAERRFAELSKKGMAVSKFKVLQDVIARDKRDAERDVSPMAAAENAETLDTTQMSIGAAVAAAIAIVEKQRML